MVFQTFKQIKDYFGLISMRWFRVIQFVFWKLVSKSTVNYKKLRQYCGK